MGPLRRRTRHLAAGVGLALAVGALLWMGRGYLGRLGVRPSPARQSPADSRARGTAGQAAGGRLSSGSAPGLELQGTRLRVIDPRTGRVAWELTLEKAEARTDTGETWLNGVRAVYHNLDGSTSQLASGEAHLAAGGAALVFTGEVRLTGPGGATLAAGTLRWEAGREEFRATGGPGGKVTFVHGPTTLSASAVQGDLALKRVRAAGGVRVSGGEWGS